MTVSIRPAQLADAKFVIGQVENLLGICLQKAWGIPIPNGENTWKEICSKPDTHPAFIATVDGEPAGVALLNIRTCLHYGGDVCELDDLCTDPKYRGKGIGSKLVKYSIQYAKDKGLKGIELLQPNPRSQGAAQRDIFYDRLGFHSAGQGRFIIFDEIK